MEISSILSLSLGLIAGVMFAIVWSKYENFSTVLDTKVLSVSSERENSEEQRLARMKGVLHGQKISNVSQVSSQIGHQIGVHDGPLKYGVGGDTFYFKFDKTVSDSGSRSLKIQEQMDIANWQMFDPQYDADKLKSAFSVFCIVTIGRSSIPSHGKSAFHTWMTHCNDFVMLSNTEDEKYKVKNAGLPDGPTKSWERTKKAFSYALANHPDHDWYVKVEHDTMIVMENYRYMLLLHQAQMDGFAGHVLTASNQRGAAVALSKEAAVQAVSAFPNCGSLYSGKEDFKELEACLKQHTGIKSSQDGRDRNGVGRFQVVLVKPSLPLNAHTSLDWAWRYIDNPEKLGQEDCCRDYPISFHNLSPNGLYLMDYVVYHMRPFGIGNYVCPAEQDKAVMEQPA